MNLKLLVSTFFLIFLAELGDKTQLAVMARAATGGDGRWTVFVAASAALVLSTILAVFGGALLNRWVPELYIKCASGALFIIFGVIILFHTLWPAPLPAAGATGGAWANLAFQLAARFEEAAASDFQELARRETDPELQRLWRTLADEEQQHGAELLRLRREHADAAWKPAVADRCPPEHELLMDVAASAAPVLHHALEHKLAIVRFYEELARSTSTPGLRQAFARLADEERKHVAQLRQRLPAGQPA